MNHLQCFFNANKYICQSFSFKENCILKRSQVNLTEPDKKLMKKGQSILAVSNMIHVT